MQESNFDIRCCKILKNCIWYRNCRNKTKPCFAGKKSCFIPSSEPLNFRINVKRLSAIHNYFKQSVCQIQWTCPGYFLHDGKMGQVYYIIAWGKIILFFFSLTIRPKALTGQNWPRSRGHFVFNRHIKK